MSVLIVDCINYFGVRLLSAAYLSSCYILLNVYLFYLIIVYMPRPGTQAVQVLATLLSKRGDRNCVQ